MMINNVNDDDDVNMTTVMEIKMWFNIFKGKKRRVD